MTPLKERKALDLFRTAVELSGTEQAAYLAAECGSDVELRFEVESLLASDAAEWSGLDTPAVRPDFHALLRNSDQPILSEGFLAGGRFKIVEQLSEGGMGVVYRAMQEHPRREVALKVMRPGSKNLLRRFEREIDILARLRHPGIAQIHDAGSLRTTSGERPYLAMELVRGAPIVAFAEGHELDGLARLELLAKVCDAVQHAHQSGVIHRDLKPDNILVEDSARGPHPRVLDFGVAALTDQSATTLATEPGALVGTVAYMAPEQIAGQAVTQSDVYALGAVLYELLCGELPIDVRKDSLGVAVRRIQGDSPLPISRRDARFRGDLETILDKALAKEPGRRYASADALATDIRHFLRHEPIMARPASAAYTLQRFARRHRVLVGVTLIAALAVMGALVVTSVALVRARSAERRALDLARVMAERTLPILTDQVGTRGEREGLTKDVHTTALSLLEQSPTDPMVLSLYADSLRQLSRLELDAGRIDDTLSLCEKALAARERAIDAKGEDDLSLQSARSIDMVLIGDAHKGAGSTAAMRTWYERAEELHTWLVERDPSVTHLEHLAWSEHRLGGLALDEERLEEAAVRADRFMELSRRVITMRPDDLTALDGLREAYVSRSSVQFRRGDLSTAAESMEQALTIGRKLVAADPRNRIYLRGHISSLVGAFSIFKGDEALERCRQLAAEASPIAERFHDADPTDVIATKALVRLLRQCSYLAEGDGDLKLAGEYVDRATALLNAISARWTKFDAYDAHSDYEHAADLYRRIGRTEEAEAASSRAQCLRALRQEANIGLGN